MLTYDDVWATFLDNYKVNDADLPNPEDDQWRVYADIKNAVRTINNRLGIKLVADDDSESISGCTDDNILLLLGHYLRHNYLVNAKTLYESLYQPISPDVGVRNYATQMNALTNSIKHEESQIQNMIFYMRSELPW